MKKEQELYNLYVKTNQLLIEISAKDTVLRGRAYVNKDFYAGLLLSVITFGNALMKNMMPLLRKDIKNIDEAIRSQKLGIEQLTNHLDMIIKIQRDLNKEEKKG